MKVKTRIAARPPECNGCLRGREIAEFVGALARPNGAILLEFHGRERYQEEDRGVKY